MPYQRAQVLVHPLKVASAGGASGGVPVHADYDLVHAPGNHPELRFGQGRTHCRHDVFEPGRVGGYHVGVALDHDRLTLLPERCSGQVQTV